MLPVRLRPAPSGAGGGAFSWGVCTNMIASWRQFLRSTRSARFAPSHDPSGNRPLSWEAGCAEECAGNVGCEKETVEAIWE
jgi:hypothetical protein